MEPKKKQKGVTLLELMVAVFILTVGISGVMGLIHRTMVSSSMAASRLKAAYLAQEGIEVVRNIRDTNWVNNRDWLHNIGTIGTNGRCDCCEVSFNHPANTQMISCDVGSLRPLRRSPDGFYQYEAGVASVFSRRIETERIGDFLRVKATVSWVERGTSLDVTVVENLYDWR